MLHQRYDGNETAACIDNENKNANERRTQAVPVASNIATLQPPLVPNQQTVVDVNGQQFFLMPVNQAPVQVFPNRAPVNVLPFNIGRLQNRGQLRGRGRSGRFQQDYMIFQKFSDLI